MAEKQVKPTTTKTPEKADDLVFETFHHRSGEDFQCIYQGGMRYYLEDWESKEWQPFPKSWYNEGLLVTDTILGADRTGLESHERGWKDGQKYQYSKSSDDREGFLMHPKRGRIPTYIFYKKHNVHMYFDKETGAWVRLPIAWELHNPMVKALVEQIMEAIPEWGDCNDILALLRACDYDPDECIAIYKNLQNDEGLRPQKTEIAARHGGRHTEKEARSQEKSVPTAGPQTKTTAQQKDYQRDSKPTEIQTEVFKSAPKFKQLPSQVYGQETYSDEIVEIKFDHENPFSKGQNYDEIELRFDSRQSLYVSRGFLAYASPVLEKVLQADFRTNRGAFLEMKDKDHAVFLDMLLNIHPRIQKPLPENTAVNVYVYAYEYDIPTVLAHSENILMKKLDEVSSKKDENDTTMNFAWEIILLSEKYQNDRLFAKAAERISSLPLTKIKSHPRFRDLSDTSKKKLMKV